MSKLSWIYETFNHRESEFELRFLGKVALGLAALLSFTVFILPEVSASDGSEPIDVGSSIFMFLCMLLVFIMAPAIALFYGGMLRKQSMTSIMAQCIGVMAVIGVVWWAVGYSLALTGDGAFIGGLDAVFGSGVSLTGGDGIPEVEFMMFQGMFAIVTACIVFGATAERVRYPVILTFLALWAVLVYAPMAHMVWGGGFLSDGLIEMGIASQDFAGGTVVHMCSGITGVAAAVAIGARSSRVSRGRSHNVPMMFIGCMALWLGWFGFNCGSELAFDSTVMLVALNTLLASCASTVAWIAIQYLHVGRVNVTGLCAGVLSGLVGITPGCGFVEPWAAVVIGVIGAAVCYSGIIFMRRRKGIDDALDVMGVHGIGGIWGALAVGVFSSMNGWGPEGWDFVGVLYGDASLLLGMAINVAVTLVYCFAVSYVLMKLIDLAMRKATGKGAALSESEQMVGADIVEHGESSYV